MAGAALGALHGGSRRPTKPIGCSSHAKTKTAPLARGGEDERKAAAEVEEKEETQDDLWWWIGSDLVGGLENDHPRGRDHAMRMAAKLVTQLDLRGV
mmetsp:Transcript_48868/g.98338  ORF Transcript_48868/g.98338 Transcript_48868/m.98338 type:complete len:97 (+) Transcript_48868:1324-1614(+)